MWANTWLNLIRISKAQEWIFLVQGIGHRHSSTGKESACSAGDPGSDPRSERFSGDGNHFIYFAFYVFSRLFTLFRTFFKKKKLFILYWSIAN